MAILDPIKTTILATRLIPNVDRTLARALRGAACHGQPAGLLHGAQGGPR